MELAIPDLISNSYFPVLAAAELGYFQREGLDVSVELIFPVDRAYEAFANKRNLLTEVVNRAMTGADLGGVSDQEWWTEQLEEPDPAEQVAIAQAWLEAGRNVGEVEFLKRCKVLERGDIRDVSDRKVKRPKRG